MSCLQKVKLRGVGKENKQFMRVEPKGTRESGLFGMNLVRTEDKEVVITEGEYDAMSVYQATNILAVSLPYGANHLPIQTIPFFDQFSKIYLWMDNDQAGQLNITKIADKLDSKKVQVVKSIYKDANEALLMDS